uniref:Akirin-2 n=1 Tax=Bos mutus grunniens TaxID=30521 RepID=A0A8B9YJD8_BOSMU
MACGATLKRTLDFDPLLSPASPKRRRCAPLSAPTSAAATPSSAAAATAASFSAAAASPQKYLRMEPSPFGDVSSRLTTEQILYNIKQEYKRMQKRRHLETSFQQTDPCCTSDAQPHAFLLSGPASPDVLFKKRGMMFLENKSTLRTPSGTSSPLKKEQPLFTLRQVGMICERLLKEREEKVREEYEEILNTKLAEQYDAFVKFTHDQIMRRYGEQPASYVS